MDSARLLDLAERVLGCEKIAFVRNGSTWVSRLNEGDKVRLADIFRTEAAKMQRPVQTPENE